MDHLESMDYLRNSVRLRAYGQRDPLVEYKKEGLRMFHELEDTLRAETLRLLPNVGETMLAGEAPKEETELTESGGSSEEARKKSEAEPQPARRGEDGEKIGRNDQVEITDGKETKTMKYKKAKKLLDGGSWHLVR
jgi:preprotein translocase subunit SecA